MKAPSIETRLARTEASKLHGVTKALHDLPLIGTVVRAWIRAFGSTQQTLWATLPPIAA